jgi:hypothetical protein
MHGLVTDDAIQFLPPHLQGQQQPADSHHGHNDQKDSDDPGGYALGPFLFRSVARHVPRRQGITSPEFKRSGLLARQLAGKLPSLAVRIN